MTNYTKQDNTLNRLFKRVLAYLFNSNRQLALNALDHNIRVENDTDVKNHIMSFKRDVLEMLNSNTTVVPEHLKLSNYRYVGT